ncbi:MAG TPA: Gfo/Idh/MocA family oxidoreductase [Trueperaceae bacterium]|nr:Gfo/Idh/MocA family oxidoreductase [Trueperaceae bacterium]
MTSEGPLRVAIIGTGSISQAHYDGFRAAGANVVALCDVNPVQLAARATAWGVDRTYSDFGEMFAAGGIDAVSIAAPTAVHHPATMAAAKAGVHVLVEKPIALDLGLADEMIAACDGAGVKLVVNHQLRSSAPAKKAKELIQAGAIGRVTHLRLRQAHDWGGQGVRPSFATKASSGGGTLLDNGCHLADLARFFGGRVREVYARVATLAYDVEVEDTANVSLEFGDGAIGTIETAWTATGWEEGFWIYGTEGALESTNRFGPPWLRHYYRGTPGGTWDVTDLATYSFGGYKPHTAHVIAFVAAVRGEGQVVCSGVDGREAVRLILAAYASAADGTVVRLADAPETFEEAVAAS